MFITLMARQQLHAIALPDRASGCYGIFDETEEGCIRKVVAVEGLAGQWLLRSGILSLLDKDGQPVETLPLTGVVQVIHGRYAEHGQPVQLFVEPSDERLCSFEKYGAASSLRITIGRISGNHIRLDSPYVSAHHACLEVRDGTFFITDTQSANGVYVNGRQVFTARLSPGDLISIMGLKLIIGKGFFAMNGPAVLEENIPGVWKLDVQFPDQVQPVPSQPKEAFHPSPRIVSPFSPARMRVDAPPPTVKFEEIPLGLLLGPALTMGMTSLLMGAMAVRGLALGETELVSALPTMAMSLSMLCGTLLWPFLTKHHEKKRRLKTEAHRKEAYRAYLDQLRSQLYTMAEKQKESLLERLPDLAECQRRILGRSQGLWERTAQHGDFLHLRLGTGPVPLKADLDFPDLRFSPEDDALQKELRRFAEEPKLLRDAPMQYSLLDTPVLGVVGSRREGTAFLQGLVLQLAALHSSDEVKLAFLSETPQNLDWDVFRFLPHVWNGRAERLFAVGVEEERALAASLEAIAETRLAEKQDPVLLPHYVILSIGDSGGKLFSKSLPDPGRCGFSFLFLAGEASHLPKECGAMVRLDETTAVLHQRNLERQEPAFSVETAEGLELEPLVQALSDLTPDGEQQARLPSVWNFLEMYAVGKVEHLNVLTRWKENNPVNSLRAPIGVGEDGEPFYLDLHEKYHGPHGLIAGMTGSGKSEFIITLILSLAVNYRPEEVAFIIIDYKGGGLSGAFENQASGVRLPHLVGTITNLDGAAVSRALISIQSELRRRQAIFNEARAHSGEGMVDIYKYQNMYRSGLVQEPVPHLLIISDEFAELKAQQPEFMSQLISTARIGRSLGVHLLLATQKPSGVVDDQIWSNSRFRICLKVQERADSMEMLKRPEAAELRETGRFFLQVGFNELFQIGQSAWSGAPYVPADRIPSKRGSRVAVIDGLGRTLLEARAKTESHASSKSQVVAVVEYLSAIAAGEKIHIRQLWLPALPERLDLAELRKAYRWNANPLILNPLIGEYDDPSNQAKGPVSLPFTEQGNVLVYGMTGAGKNTLLNTVLYGLLQDYDAASLNVYIVDFGEETLQVYSQAPQVGGVMLSSDGERIRNLFRMLLDEMSQRKRRFAESGGDLISYCSQTGKTVPHVLVILRNYSAFSEQFEALEGHLLQLLRECSKYGIYFLITANSANAVRYRITQNAAVTIALRLNDRADYTALFGPTDGVYPARVKGRGLVRMDRIYEFQTASAIPDGRPQALRDALMELRSKAACFAPPVPSLPERVVPSLFREHISPSRFPIGIEKQSLHTCFLNLEKTVLVPILAQSAGRLAPVIGGLCETLAYLGAPVTALDGARILAGSAEASDFYIRDEFSPCIDELFQELLRRNHSYKQCLAEGKALPEYEPRYYIVTGLKAIWDSLTEEARDRFSAILEKAEPEYGVRFFLCDAAKIVSGFSTSPWYRRIMEEAADRLWVGGGLAEQYVYELTGGLNGQPRELPSQFGYLLRRGEPRLIKMLVSEREEEVD